MKNILFAGAALAAAIWCAAAVPAPAAPASAPTTWDNLVRTPSKKLKAVYLLPQADFRTYTKVMIDPAEVAFQKDWLRRLNDSASSFSARVSPADAQKIANYARTGFDDIFAKAFTEAGYQVVTEPGPDVLRLRPGVLDLYVAAPYPMTEDMQRVYTVDAGEATFLLEARDSTSGAVLGRAVDHRIAGDNTDRMPRSTVSNRGDVSAVFKLWASASVKGLGELKALSPVGANGQVAAR